MTSSALAPATGRLEWVDVAKGIAITLVVLFHAVIFLTDIGLAGFWAKLSGPLDTFRMPLFFFTAGLFAQNLLRAPLLEVFRRRSAKLVWLYLLWSAVWAVVFQFLPVYRDTDGQTMSPILLWLRALVLPNESLWFLYALALYFVAARVIRPLPMWVQLVLAGAISVIVGSAIIDWGNSPWEKTLTYFFFFLLAVHFGPRIRHTAPGIRWWAAVAVMVGYGVLLAVALRLDLLAMPGTRLVLGVAGVAAGIGLSVLIGRAQRLRWVSLLGKNTLPVYVLHFYVVLGGVAVLAQIRATAEPFSAVWVPALTAAGILVSLGIHRVSRRVPGLWDLPRKWRYPVAADSVASKRLT
ncbi:Inner membrane protein YcfT [Microbacterium lemovicicum]|uniref:Inner membrane protein YcfT n=2 Tax=Microbacterium lemovicicum TaxID=1072463 RepID=A0A3Q9J090_9MICO|nr:acyltransferase family protein [Microbacterium lemovicicum]AZS35611.1 Inner membrane protein YcfT [Microbacterium lemovicicum]AZS36852.1 Inner membrane protein YcfT [Microbacterium lemovicicum]